MSSVHATMVGVLSPRGPLSPFRPLGPISPAGPRQPHRASGFRPTADRRFCPCARNGRILTPITCITDEDDGGFHWTENLVRVLARYLIDLVTSTRGTCSPRWRC